MISTAGPAAGALLPTVTASLLLFSFFMLFFGLLLGIICVKCFDKTPPTNKTVSTTATMPTNEAGPTPVYEEIPLSAESTLDQDGVKIVKNEAYEQLPTIVTMTDS